MSLLQKSRKFLIALTLVLILATTTACAGLTQTDRTTTPSATGSSVYYGQLERGNTSVSQDFGDWVVQTARGLVQDVYVRDNNKLGVVITPQVRPQEVRSLAKSLAQGFRHNFPDRDLAVLMYAPDKQLILTARYNNQSKQLEYQ